VLKIGDRELNVHLDFRLYMQTKLSNPNYPPEIQAECTLINFSVTEEGLEDQLLAYIIRLEREDLANTKEDLVKKQREYNIQLNNLENSLLSQLKNATGDILANVTLVDNLEKSKVISDDIKIKVAEGQKTDENITLFSEK
jgi:dynein heavy chain